MPAVSAETALTGITQNLYMPKTDAAEDELGFALQSNFYQIGYDQRGRIKTFSRSAQATVGLPAIYETQAYAWDKNGNPTQITGTLKGMAVGSTTTSSSTTAPSAAKQSTSTIVARTSTATTAAPAAITATNTASTSSMNWQPLPAAQRSTRAGRSALGFKNLPIPPSRLSAVAARPPLPRNHAAGAFDLQGKALIHSDKDSDYIYSAAQPSAGQYNAAGIDTSAATAAISHAPVYAQPAQSWGKGKDKSQDKNAAEPSAAAPSKANTSKAAATASRTSAYAANATTTNNLTDPPPEPVQAGFSVNYQLSLNPSSSNRATGAQLNASFTAPEATTPELELANTLNWPQDAAGNQLRDFNSNYQLGFDAAGRLARTHYGGSSAFQFYDLNGQRIFKTETQSDSSFDTQNPAGSLTPNTAGVYYQYDQNGNLLWQQPAGGVGTDLLEHEAATHYYWLPTPQGDILVGFDQGINSYAVYTDHLGTPRLVTKIENPQNPKPSTDTSNDLPLADYDQPEGISPMAIPVWQWSYSPFGADLANGYEAQPTSIKDNFKPSLWSWMGLPETGGADFNQVAQETWRVQANLHIPPVLNIRYPGQYYDFESGLVQNWWRTYEPRMGRYTSADPIGLNGGWNRFAYANQDGINQYDPYGLWVTGTYQRSTGELTLRDIHKGTSIRGSFESGGNPFGEPIPKGSYDILTRAGRSGFYRLEAVDSVYGDDKDEQTKRTQFRLHHPGRTLGCIAAKNDKDWEIVEDFINSTKSDNVVVPSMSRWLWVPPVLRPQSIPSTESLRRYGRIEVID